MSGAPQRGRTIKQSSSSLPLIIGVVGAILVIAIIVIAAVNSQSASTTTAPSSTLAQTAIANTSTNSGLVSGQTPEKRYYKGSPDAPIKIIEFADFQCPACASFANSPIRAQIDTEYIKTGKVQLIFHDFPLSQHQFARSAALAARCAADQGSDKFWAFHDTLYADQENWSKDNARPVDFFNTYATQLGLNVDAFKACVAAGKHNQFIADSVDAAYQLQIPATPTFLMNGQQYNAAQILEAIKAAAPVAPQSLQVSPAVAVPTP